jgi:hypothetical protein
MTAAARRASRGFIYPAERLEAVVAVLATIGEKRHENDPAGEK